MTTQFNEQGYVKLSDNRYVLGAALAYFVENRHRFLDTGEPADLDVPYFDTYCYVSHVIHDTDMSAEDVVFCYAILRRYLESVFPAKPAPPAPPTEALAAMTLKSSSKSSSKSSGSSSRRGSLFAAMRKRFGSSSSKKSDSKSSTGVKSMASSSSTTSVSSSSSSSSSSPPPPPVPPPRRIPTSRSLIVSSVFICQAMVYDDSIDKSVWERYAQKGWFHFLEQVFSICDAVEYKFGYSAEEYNGAYGELIIDVDAEARSRRGFHDKVPTFHQAESDPPTPTPPKPLTRVISSASTSSAESDNTMSSGSEVGGPSIAEGRNSMDSTASSIGSARSSSFTSGRVKPLRVPVPAPGRPGTVPALASATTVAGKARSAVRSLISPASSIGSLVSSQGSISPESPEDMSDDASSGTPKAKMELHPTTVGGGTEYSSHGY